MAPLQAERRNRLPPSGAHPTGNVIRGRSCLNPRERCRWRQCSSAPGNALATPPWPGAPMGEG
eukprot:1310806-Alexandrium_andersonii.AAC.1